MKQKHNPKRKVEDVYRELKLDAQSFLNAFGFAPDEIKPQSREWAEIYFAVDNPQARHAARGLRVLEQGGYIAIDGFLSSVITPNGPDLTARIHIKRERLQPLPRWQRVKSWLGLS